jgi:hypothetical protein
MILKFASFGFLGVSLTFFAGCDSSPSPAPPSAPSASSPTPAEGKGAPAATSAPKTNTVPN